MRALVRGVFGLFTALVTGCGADSSVAFVDGGVVFIDGGVRHVVSDAGQVAIFNDGGVRFLDGGVVFADGGEAFIDGGVRVGDGGISFVDGGIRTLDGGTEPIDGGTVFVDGGVRARDGGTIFVDGGVRNIDGGLVVTDGGVVFIDGGVATSPAGRRFEVVDAGPTDAGNLACHNNRGGPWELLASGTVGRIDGFGEEVVYAALGDNLWIHEPRIDRTTTTTAPATTHDVHVFGPNLVAVSSTDFNTGISRVDLFDGVQWTATGTTPRARLWGCQPDDLWAASGGSRNGQIRHFDGTRWSQPVLTSSVGFTDIDGFACDDIWTQDVDGRIFRFDGQTWNLVTQTAERSGRIWVAPGGTVFVTDLFVGVHRFDGVRWDVLATPFNGVFGVAGITANDVFVHSGGGDDSIAHIRPTGITVSPSVADPVFSMYVTPSGCMYATSEGRGTLYRASP